MIRLEVYSTGLTPIQDPRDEIKLASSIRYTTYYPGGVFGTLHVVVPRKVAEYWDVQGAQRLVAREGLQIVFEGWIDNLRKAITQSGERVDVTATGAWGSFALRLQINKPWADTRVSNDVWLPYFSADKFMQDRQDRILFIPKSEEILNNNNTRARYYAPPGNTIKRVTFNYDFSEDALTLPKASWYFDGVTYYDQVNSVDGDPATVNAGVWNSAHYWYVGFSEEQRYNCGFLRWQISVGNTVVSTLSCEYWNGSAWTALTVSDGTAVSSKTMAQTGNVVFTLPENITETNVNGRRYLWMRFKVSVTTSNSTWQDIYVGKTQAWEFGLADASFNPLAGAYFTASGSGSVDHTLATPQSMVQFYFIARANQIGVSNGTVYGKLTSVVVYTETGSINLTEIAKDLRAGFTSVGMANSTDNFIGSNTLSLVPFYTSNFERPGDTLLRAAKYGDASFNPWAVYFDSSELAPTPDGKPVLVAELIPSVASGYDFNVRFGEIDTSLGDVSYEENFDQIRNYIVVEYEDAFISGKKWWKTPDDDATLKDQTSIDKYGRRDLVLTINTTDSAKAIQWGKVYLAQYKNPIVRMTSPIVVAGSIETSQGSSVPVSYVRAGKRLRITDFLGTDVTFLISNADYSDGRVTIYAGDGGVLI